MLNAPPQALDTDRLHAFVSVVQEGGFSRAARRLGKTQSAISQAVAALEEELGHQLVVRRSRGSHATAAGAIVLEHAQRAFDELDAARARLAALSELEAGEVTLGTSDTLAYYLLPEVFSSYRTRFPGIEMKLRNRPSPIVAREVASREVDLGIISLPLPPELEHLGRPLAEQLTITPLLPQPDVAIAAPTHALARESSVTLKELLRYPLLLLDHTTSTRAFLDSELEALECTPQVAMEMNSVEVLKRLVELDFGVAIVPRLAVAREVSAGALVALQIHATSATRQVGLITPRRGPLSRAAQAFCDLTQELLVPEPAC